VDQREQVLVLQFGNPKAVVRDAAPLAKSL